MIPKLKRKKGLKMLKLPYKLVKLKKKLMPEQF